MNTVYHLNKGVFMVGSDLKSMVMIGKITVNKKMVRIPAIDIPEGKMIKLRKIAALTYRTSDEMSVSEVVEYAIDRIIAHYEAVGLI
jgi:ribosomal protein S4